MGIAVGGETPSLTREFVGETHRVLEHTQTHQPRNQHQKGPINLWVVGKVTESEVRAKQAELFPLRPPPLYTVTQCSDMGCPALANT